ncbi:MAG: hypothetical protein NC335_07900 [Bacteroides sp.]|nr:hypothetical protein [Bacteroides sp.]
MGRILHCEWQNIITDGVLDNDKLQDVCFGRFERMVKKHGLRDTIRLAYGDVGCHSDIKDPVGHSGEDFVWGPVFKIHDEGRIEKGCSDFRRPLTSTSFFMNFACELLKGHEEYETVGVGIWEYYVPRSDYSLPVYSRQKGKLHFASQQEKEEAIRQIKERGEYYAY